MNTKLNLSLPVSENDHIFKLDNTKKTIKLGHVIYSASQSSLGSDKNDDICVMFNDYQKKQTKESKINVLESNCYVGMNLSSLKEQDKYGTCLNVKSKAVCVVLDENNQDNKYLLNIDTDRLQHFSEITNDLCFYQSSIFEVSDIYYLIKLKNNRNNNLVELITSRRDFMRKFRILSDKYCRAIKYERPKEIKYSAISPFTFNEIIGKIVVIDENQLTKKRSNANQMKLLFGLNETLNLGDLKNSNLDTSNKENQNKDKTIKDILDEEKIDLEHLKSTQFTIIDVTIDEVVLNCVKDFIKSDMDVDYRQEKIKGNQLDKVKFFKMSKKEVKVGGRFKLDLNENDQVVNFEQYQDYLNSSVKSKILNSPKYKELILDEYKVLVNDNYENEKSLDKSITEYNNMEIESNVNEDDDNVFLEDNGVSIDKNLDNQQISQEEAKNNLILLSRTKRNRSVSNKSRSTSERLMNTSFKNIKFDTSVEEFDIAENEELNNEINQNKQVLVDVLYIEEYVDAHWQDNIIENDIPLHLVYEEIDNLIDKFYPGNFIEFTGEPKSGIIPTYGIVQEIKKNTNLALCKWFYEKNLNETKTWTTLGLEPVFNLKASYVHFHLGDLVVDHRLIIDSSIFSIDQLTKLIGVIKQISVDGTAIIQWIDGSKTSDKKITEFVSFFDFDFESYDSDESDDSNESDEDGIEESFSTIHSVDSKETSGLHDNSLNSSDLNDYLESKNNNLNLERNRFSSVYRFNKYKFELNYLLNGNNSIDYNKFKDKWLKKIDTILNLVNEMKDIQLEYLIKIGYCYLINHEQDKKFVDHLFQQTKCWYTKIKNNVSQINLDSKTLANEFNDYYSKLIFSLNNWLDLIQTNHLNFYMLLDENNKFKNNNHCAHTEKVFESKNDLDDDTFSVDDEKVNKIEIIIKSRDNKYTTNDKTLREFKMKTISLINKFNKEIINDILLDDDDDEEEEEVYFDTQQENKSNDLNESSNSIKNNESIKFKKLCCVSIENLKHKYLKSANKSQPNLKRLRRELNLLKNSLPESGICIRTFEERLDLFSLMLEGAKNTVYENNLFLFDLKVQETINEAPECFYIQFGKNQINPNLYKDGNVCLSLLGTFYGRSEQERWTNDSSIYQLAVSLQALVLNKAPFFNEADFDVYSQTSEGYKKAKLYNEHVIVSLSDDYIIELMNKREDSPFKNEILKYYQSKAFTIFKRYFDFLIISSKWDGKEKDANYEILDDLEKERIFKEWVKENYPEFNEPDFPLLPGTKGFCISLLRNLKVFANYFKDNLPVEEVELMIKQINELSETMNI